MVAMVSMLPMARVNQTEQAEDNATGRLLEGIIESIDEFYSENLAQEVVQGMTEASSRGFFMASNAPLRLQEGEGQRRGEGPPDPGG